MYKKKNLMQEIKRIRSEVFDFFDTINHISKKI